MDTATLPAPIEGRCTARSSRTGLPCKKRAVLGATVCASHGGRAPQVKRAAARRLALGEAMAELDRLGRPIDVDPAEAMLAMVREAAGNVAVLRRLVQSLRAEVDERPGGVLEDLGDDVDLDDLRLRELGQGIAGRVDPANWKASAHVWVTLYDEERERLVRWSKACRDAGVDERRVQIAEQVGELIVRVLHRAEDGLVALLEQLGVDGGVLVAVREGMPGIVRGAFEAVDTTGAEQ